MDGEQRSENPNFNHLADRVLESVKNDDDTSGFHDQINSMSNEERLNFVKELNNKSSNVSVPTDGHIFFADTNLDNESGEIIDIDIVHIDRNSPDNSIKETRVDLYTPGDEGEEFDNKQEINQTLSPYKNILHLLNSTWPHENYSNESNKALVTNLIKSNNTDNPNLDTLLEEFNNPSSNSEASKYLSFDGITSFLANDQNKNQAAPTEIQELLKYLRLQKQQSPLHRVTDAHPLPNGEKGTNLGNNLE